MGFHNWIIERQQLLERIKELEAENAELKKRLGEVVMPEVQEPTAMQTLSLQEKVELSKTSGIVNYVISESSSAQNALIVSSLL